MDISATDRNPEPGDNPLFFSTDSKGSFRCTQPQTVMHTTKPLLNQLGTTGICPHRSHQPTQDSNPGPSDHESQTLCVTEGRNISNQNQIFKFVIQIISTKEHGFQYGCYESNSRESGECRNGTRGKSAVIINTRFSKLMIYKVFNVYIYILENIN